MTDHSISVFHYASFMSSIVPESWIVLESAYSLNDRVFLQNLGTILLYAFIGSILSFLLVGATLYGLALSGAMGVINITVVQCFLFASFIVAVDPVAVLAIFQEVGVNDVLYFLVFGESLLNDAVTVVLSNMMKAFLDMDPIPLSQIALGVGSFFTISLGGLSIGIVFGILTALITRTTKHVRVVEPLTILILAYLSFIVAELFHWSGIISMIGCGLVQAQYSFHNISTKSLITVEYFIKMLASIQDAVIFLFLGLELIRANHVWHTGFIMWSLLLCLVYRAITVFSLTFLVNRIERTHPIKYTEQFIMWYGGLRGAVCFALCETITDKFELKPLFMTATFVIIMFTVFVQGITIKPLVNLCNIALKEEIPDTLIGELQIQSWLQKMNEKHFRRWFQNDPMTREQQILQVYHTVTLEEYEEAVRQGVQVRPEQDATQPGAAADRFSLLPEFSGVDQSILRRKKPTSMDGGTMTRQRSILDTLTRNHVSADVNTAADFRNLLKSSSTGHNIFHKRHDPDIVHDQEHDIAAQLSERHARLSRYRSHWRRSNMTSSHMGSDTSGSQLNLAQAGLPRPRLPSLVQPPSVSDNGTVRHRYTSSSSHGSNRHTDAIEMKPFNASNDSLDSAV
ncbi:hypothetical protein CAPTEDRAFT_224019 [Capitella teleta]|uniref:Sodium/hydrogen exchanger n=1 Tax=Capitella teleta TaxID=283909 RepID=R7UM52_CAPTE|nr:hypothetical protein CAPTEDRAFT_224019 [Capitella teleta]|eukprot:ELU07584.1 hypothetical protein CAPTEDRAFT_224019 [Capitella teleta]